jgi:hypothetical protein
MFIYKHSDERLTRHVQVFTLAGVLLFSVILHRELSSMEVTNSSRNGIRILQELKTLPSIRRLST